MTTKTWIIFAAICVGIVGGLIYLSGGNKIDISAVDTNAILQGSEKNGQIADHVYGNKDSKVILIEYGDYQCPGCKNAYPAIKEVVEKYKDKIGFVFRNFPLYSAHANALAAATSAEAAAKQGKFWEMHDLLYENQNDWNQLGPSERTEYFVTQAKSLGLDETKFRASFEDKTIKQKIDFDVALGKKLSITGTPSFFINGKNVSDLRYSGDKIDTSGSTESPFIWNNAAAFEKLIIKPALEEKGISL